MESKSLLELCPVLYFNLNTSNLDIFFWKVLRFWILNYKKKSFKKQNFLSLNDLQWFILMFVIEKKLLLIIINNELNHITKSST